MTDTTPTQSRPILLALEGLRGTAALMVVLDHSYANFVGTMPVDPAAYPPWPLGTLGVATFFIISGFIMVHIHGEDFGQPGAPRNFFARRFVRIWPFYALMTLIYVSRLGLTGRMPDGADLLRSLLFIPYQNPAEPYGHPVLGQGWTLNYEAMFYAVFGLALLVRRGLVLVVGGMLSLFMLGWLELVTFESWLGFWSHADILFFVLGIGIGLIRRRLRIGPGFPVALGLAMGCMAAGVVAGFAWQGRLPLQALLAPAAVGAVAAGAWARETGERSLLRAGAERIGSATFAIYLSHTFVIGLVTKYISGHLPGLSAWIVVPVLFVLGTAFGMVVHVFVERPLLRGWRRLLGVGRRPGLPKHGAQRLLGTVAMACAVASALSQAEAAVPPERLATMARGINLSEVVQGNATYGHDLARLQAILTSLAAAGFTHVRLPVGSGLFVIGSAGYERSPAVTADTYAASLGELRQVVAAILAHGMSVTIDMHQDASAFVTALHCDVPQPCALAEQQLEAFWDRAAGDLADMDPGRVFFELLNEPNMPPGEWRRLAERLIATVRRHAPGYTLLVGGAGWDSPDMLMDMQPFADGNIVYVVHFYDPKEFTHQGAAWDPSMAGLRDVPFPTTVSQRSVWPPFTKKDVWDAGRIDMLFGRVAAWGRANRAPITLNEFGVIAHARQPDRACWIRAVRGAAERHGISWAFWDYFYPEAFGLAIHPGGTPAGLNPQLAAALGLSGGDPRILESCR